MPSTHMKHGFALLSAAALLAVSASAQCFSASGTSIVALMTPTLTGYPATDEGISPELALGFNFPMAGIGFTASHCCINANGDIYLTDGLGAGPVNQASFGCDSLVEFRGVAGASPRICAWSDDMDGVDILVDTSVAGQFKVTWVDYAYWTQVGVVAFDFSVILYDTGVIQFDYGSDPFDPTTAGVGVSIGNNVGTGAEPQADLLAGGDTGTLGLLYDVPVDLDMPWNLGGQTLNLIPNGSGGYTYVTGCSVLPASHTVMGDHGCYQDATSFYQFFQNATSASPALSGNVLTLLPAGTGYLGTFGVGTAAATYHTPTGAATPLALTDDSQLSHTPLVGFPSPFGPVNSIQVHGNAMIAFGVGTIDYPGTNSYTPTRPGFLNAALGGVYAWHDYNLSEGGTCTAEEAGGKLYITYENVESYSTPTVVNPSTLQFQFDQSSGEINVVFLSIDADATSAFGSAHLVGWTVPGPSLDVGSIDLATQLPIVTDASDTPGMKLSAGPAPSPGTLVTYTVNDARDFAPGFDLGIVVISATPAALPLQFFDLTADPACTIFAPNLDATLAFVGPSGPQSVQLFIPSGVPTGIHVYAQAVALVPGLNQFLGGLQLSNGIDSFVN